MNGQYPLMLTLPGLCLPRLQIGTCRTIASFVVGLVLLLVTARVAVAVPSGKFFSSPLSATDALLVALRDEDEEALITIFGEAYRDVIDTPDEAAERVTRQEFLALARQKLTFEKRDDKRVKLLIGPDDWPMPIPLIGSDEGWAFDTAEGEQELLRRRIGMNELAAIEAVDAVIDAQLQYAAMDANGNAVRDFAQAFVSQPGMKDGLYWEQVEDAGSTAASPLSQFVADAEPYLKGRRQGDPFRGYYFRILRSQGKAARGGTSEYLRGSHMVGGFAVVAYPARYEVTGVMTFIANHEGRIYERDLGEKTAQLGAAMNSFNPDSNWRLVTE